MKHQECPQKGLGEYSGKIVIEMKMKAEPWHDFPNISLVLEVSCRCYQHR
jgi:hypothetical protein